MMIIPKRWVRIKLPDGRIRVVTESTYDELVSDMQSLAKALETAEFIGEPKEKEIMAGHTFIKMMEIASRGPHADKEGTP